MSSCNFIVSIHYCHFDFIIAFDPYKLDFLQINFCCTIVFNQTTSQEDRRVKQAKNIKFYFFNILREEYKIITPRVKFTYFFQWGRDKNIYLGSALAANIRLRVNNPPPPPLNQSYSCNSFNVEPIRKQNIF